MSHNDLLVLGVACMVEGEATNESLQLVGAHCGWCGQERGGKSNQQVIWTRWCLVWPAWLKEKQKKAPTSHYDSLVPVVAGVVEGEATNEG